MWHTASTKGRTTKKEGRPCIDNLWDIAEHLTP